MSIKYWYKSQEESSIWEDISSQISKHIIGSNTINNVPSEFEFQISPFVKSGSNTIFSGILISIGDKVLVTQDDSLVIAYGTVFDNGPELLGWDRKNNIPYQQFNVKAEEDDFSSSVIDKFEYTDTSISAILNEIMLYTDESLNNTIGKYILNIEDYNIAFSLEKKTAREALTELCEQIDCFWILKTSLIPDDTEIFKIYRYIEISSRSGIVPEVDSDWYDGIQNKHVRDGKIENPITENRSSIPYIAAESNFKIDSDKSMIVNYIDLSCKVYESDSSSTYVRASNIPALPGLFDYQIDGYVDDIKYIAIQIKTNVMAGSTSTIVRVPSNRAANNMMKAGDKVYFEDHLDAYEEASFFEILSVNTVNDTYTEIEFDTLPFTPVASDKFEVISNVDIYRSENDVNYSTKGVLIDCDKKSYAKIKFLPLSEPPSGQNITVIYTKCIDYTYTNKNDESIAKHGLKYKEIKIDDSITLTRSELENLASKLLTLNPVYKFSVSSRRYGLVPIGLAISVKITNFITETFILNENSFEYLGANDRNKKPAFIQNLTFSTQIGRPDKLIEKLQQQKKKTASNAENLSKNKQIESIKIQDYITWSFNPLSGVEDTSFTPPTPTFDSIVVNDLDSFTFTYTPATGVNVYRIDVSTVSDFSTKISGYNNKGIFRSGTWTVNGLVESGATTVYLRMRALSYDNVYSSYSSTETINLEALEERILYMKSVSSIFQIFSSKLDGTDEQQHTSTINVINDAVYLPNADIVFSKNTGTEYKLFRINKDESYATEHELLDDSDNPLTLNNYFLGSSHNGNYIAYMKESPPSTSNLYEYNINTRVETQLTSGDPPFSYSPQYDHTDENIYYSSGTFASTLYINKYDRSLASNEILNTVSKSLFNTVDSDNNYLYYGQFSTFPNLIIKKFNISTEVSTDIVTTGNTYFNNIFLNFAEDKLYFANDRSPHSGQYKIYRCDLDGSSQEILIGGFDSENYLICDLKRVSI